MKSRTIQVELSAEQLRSEIEMLLRRYKKINEDEDVREFKFVSEDPDTLNNMTVIPMTLTLRKQQEVKRKSYNG